jgi:uncharacterized membrane protein SirB2
MTPLIIKHLHLTFVALALLIFLLRGALMFMQSPLLGKKWLKISPHIINTLMLVSGIALALQLQINPAEHSWLAAKLIAIALFIALGIALVKLSNPLAKKILWFDALIVFGYIVSVAITKNPLGFLAF